MLQAGRSLVEFPMRSLDFLIGLSFQPQYGPEDDSASERNEYPPPGGIGQPECKAENLTAIYDPIVWKMWEPRRLTTLLASTAC
jgi:hypothetical protein